MVTAKDSRKSHAKKVAKDIADSVNSTISKTFSNVNASSFTTNISEGKALESINVPGLHVYTPNVISAMLPDFNHEQYTITNPLEPGNLPQLTQSEAEKATTIYDGAIRALQVTGKAFDVTRERFTVIGKHAKTLNAGIQVATETEKVKGSYLGYLNEVENTHQKNIELGVNQVRTQTASKISVYSKIELEEQEKIARGKAEMMRLKDAEIQAKLLEFKKSLGYLSGSE